MSQFQAKVKGALSGDTLILTNPRGLERTFSLAYVSAPRLRREGDETFAYQSREYLRELLVGKIVSCEVLYTIPTTKREYGRVKLPTGTDLPDAAVSEGWAKVREDAGKKDAEDSLAYLDDLRELESKAKSASKGVWAASTDGIKATYDVTDPAALIEEYKGLKVEVIVERVLTGDRVIVRLLLNPQKHIQTILVLAGIRAPATQRTNADGSQTSADPYGSQAHQFVEERLHQRKCAVQLFGVTPQGQLVGSVIHPRGNIAKFLLEAGLARCNDQHVTMLGSDMSEFRQAEKVAKDSKRALFAGHVGGKPKATTETDYVVSRIVNADTILIRTRSGQEKKVSLSSVRQPKPSDPKQSAFGADAKEFVRKRLIGKHVKVSIDGKKPASEGYDEREVATVTHNDKNIALALVEAGYASVIRHRRDDDDRSPEYDALLLAEEAAQKEEKGMWASKPPAAKRYQDYSESLQKAKMEASVLQRQKKVPAVVDFAKSGSRFTLLVPRDNAKLTFVLSGIRAPKSARNPGESSEPFGQEAHDFANRRCMQRDVEIDVETTDKVGGFIGTMYVGRENFARALVEEGLAEVHAYSAEQSGHSNELFNAEKKAKEARRGIWHDWDPSKDLEEDEQPLQTNGANGTEQDGTEDTQRRKDYRDVTITHVDETGRLKLQQVGPGTAALTELMNGFRSFHLNKANDQPLAGPPKAGDIVAAKFTVDNDWYRARVRRVDRDAKKAEVMYLDYGNSELIPWTRLRPLSQPQFSTQKLKPQAMDAVLSYVQLPPSAHYLSDVINFLLEQMESRNLVANVDYVTPEGTMHVTLLDPKISTNLDQSINAEVIREGLGMVPRKLKAWERASGDTLESLRVLEKEANKEHRGMWEYGDLTED